MRLCDQWNRQVDRLLHLLRQQMLDLRLLCRRTLHDQLVVYLHQKPGAQALPLQAAVYPHHGQLHDIGGSALHRHIQCHPLAEFPQIEVAAFQLRQGAAAVHQRLDIAVPLRLGHHVGHILPHALIRLKIPLHIRLGLRHRYADVLRQREGGDAVDDTEVHRLGPAAHLRCHLFRRHMEHAGGGDGVEVLP